MKKRNKALNAYLGGALLAFILQLSSPMSAEDSTGAAGSAACRLWPEGQRMFYSDPYWRGGDCASTIDLGDGRVLWLFADSYIGIKAPYLRKPEQVKMINNCLGIQKGQDPSTAAFSVYWRGANRDPEAYFPAEDSSWFWPGCGIRIKDFLVVFLMRICSSNTGLGFMTCGHAAFLIGNIETDPRGWTVSPLPLPENLFGIMLAPAVIVEPPYLYIFGVREPGDHAIYLSRWQTDSVLAGRREALEWWAGDSISWVPDSKLISEPAILYHDGATEFSVFHEERNDLYLAIQTVGFGPADIMMRTAPSLTGPWSDRHLIFQPPEKAKPGTMIYAAKAHPELTGADLVLTYMTNAPFDMIIEDSTIYYPRLIRMDWRN